MTGVALALTACATSVPSGATLAPATPSESATTAAAPAITPATPSSATSECPAATPSAPQGPSAQSVVLAEGGPQSPRITGVVYPKPAYQARLWSQWGQGVVLDDGRFLSAIGDHGGADANSFLYVYEPGQRRLTRFSDVLSRADHTKGSWGYGKIHAQMVQTSCDRVVVGTYWGTRTGLTYTGSYSGDRLFSINTATLAVESLGVPIPQHGIPSLSGFGGLVYGEAVDPRGRPGGGADVGEFFVFDPVGHRVVYRSADDRHIGFRNMGVDASGRAFLAMANGGLLRYDPGRGLSVDQASLPGGGWLRATTRPAADGTVYGVTTQPDRFIALRPDGSVADLGPAGDYIASMALSADGREVFLVPGAHGVSWQKGSPLMALDVRTGRQRVVAQLGPLVKGRLGLVLGGSYNVAVDPHNGRVFVGFNAGQTTENPWGEVVLLTVEP